VYIALVHHPVRDRLGETVTTAITNLDVHDLSRSARTYDLAGFFVVTPVEAQTKIVRAILDHWETGAAQRRVPARRQALALCQPATSIEEAEAEIERRHGVAPRRVATAAQRPGDGRDVDFDTASRIIRDASDPFLILFGTGHGLVPETLESASLWLAPVRGDASYNHLSVRAAAAIILDRLFGETGAGFHHD
jgi:hypothetical protein